MAMTLEFIVEEDFSEGLDKLQERVSNDMEHILSEMMYAATGRRGDKNAPIPKRLMDKGEYNPYLYLSGQDKNYWTFDIGSEKSSVIANYSGMRGFETQEEFLVWYEFSEEYEEDPYVAQYRTRPDERTLDRDYAFYQETGIDKYADYSNARHKHYVRDGMEEAAEQAIPYTLQSQLTRILNML